MKIFSVIMCLEYSNITILKVCESVRHTLVFFWGGGAKHSNIAALSQQDCFSALTTRDALES